MRFPHFRRHSRRGDEASPADQDSAALHPSRWTGLGDEVEAFLAGRTVEHLMARRHAVPAWAALNRLAHATAGELERTLEAEDKHGGGWVRPWALTERSLALRILGTAGPEGVRKVQQEILVPLELVLMQQHKGEALTVRRVFEAATEALDKHLQAR